MQIEIDQESGFCFGVTPAIRKAEESLRCADNVPAGPLYCLGDIVHNRRECERLHELGLRTIDHQMFRQLPAGSRCNGLMASRLLPTRRHGSGRSV